MANELHVNDVGTTLIIQVMNNGAVQDISNATSMTFIITRPDGSVLQKVGTWTTNGTDGLMQYVTNPGDIFIAGAYKIQGLITTTGGTFHTDIAIFKVLNNLV